MRALKIVGSGLTCSFRYPHFMFGHQASFEMPPPATLYGHICSALGTFFDPGEARFAVRFEYGAKFVDVETTYLITPSFGPNSKRLPKLPGMDYVKVQEGNANPFTREILFKPRITLYLDRPDWEERFKSPEFLVVLGRSQDLMTYTDVRVVDLVESGPSEIYLEHTLLPQDYIRRTGMGVSVLMPKLLDVKGNRFPTFDKYVVLHRKVLGSELIRRSDENLTFYADIEERDQNGRMLGLVFHGWR